MLPLIHHRPDSGLKGRFSLEYAAAAALLDDYPGLGSFTDAAVRRDAARRLAGLVEVKLEPGGTWLIDGRFEAEIHTSSGQVLRVSQQFPPGRRPPSNNRPDGDQTRGLYGGARYRPAVVDLEIEHRRCVAEVPASDGDQVMRRAERTDVTELSKDEREIVKLVREFVDDEGQAGRA